MVHLAAVVAVGLTITLLLRRRIHRPWLEVSTPMAERVATAVVVVVLATGATALVTLASSAALRLAPSLQFLQLLSALDIAWVTAATTIGTGWLAGRRTGVGAGVAMAVVCLWSIWAYLDAVGFTAEGGWLVDGGALIRYVLPFDIAAAVISVSVLVLGARRSARRGTSAAP
ncbi:MAG: hypothetical protein ACLFWM_10160 [Actinomycetota bacterium]